MRERQMTRGRKLGGLQPRYRKLGSRVSAGPAGEAERAQRRPSRRWYKLTRWERLARRVIEAAHYTCAMCGRVHESRSTMACNHVEPHGDDWDRFWAGPFEALCIAPCHNQAQQAREAAAAGRAGLAGPRRGQGG